MDTGLLTQICLVASTWLWRATGRRWSGEASETVRPVGRWHSIQPRGPHQNDPAYTTTFDPSFFSSRTGQYGWPSAQGRQEWAWECLLGEYPVVSVDQVVIDGALFDPTIASGPQAGMPSYRLDDQRWLVRCDGGSWPFWQDWRLPADVGPNRQGTWQVSFTFGEAPPPDGIWAAQVLAGELALSTNNDSACRLNSRVQSMARQGESMLLVDPMVLLEGKRWGIREIDMFVMAANPYGLQQRTAVLSPDIPRAVRHTG
jgi:hypothetical protein